MFLGVKLLSIVLILSRFVTAQNVDCSKGEYHPHEKLCDSYYKCVNNQPMLMKCANGLHYGPALQMCVLPEFADCQVNTVVNLR